MGSMQVINPATEELVREYDEMRAADVDTKLEMAATAYAAWRQTSFGERSQRMTRLGELLRERRDELARLMTLEMGKPITGAEQEIEKCAWLCDFYAENAERFLTPRQVETDASHSFVRYDPLGPVLAIMPWNFPYWQVFRFAVPAVMAGNVGLLKHATNVTGVGLAIEELFTQANFPAGVMSTLLVGSERVAEIISRDEVRAVTLTGSERAGRSVAEAAGQHIKKTVLELGGSDPFLVLGDADPAAAAEVATAGRTINSGQSCIASKRFIVEESVAEPFTTEMTRRMQELRMGDPLDRDTQIGPLARGDLREELHDQVQRSVQAGARVLTGGKPSEGRGFFYPPTVLDRVAPGMPAFDEETFGPVAAIIVARDSEHAVELANQNRYGLGATIYTGDTKRGEQLAAEIESGVVFINSFVKSDPRLPFGGVKKSGYGRELSDVGIHEFVNVKTVWVA